MRYLPARSALVQPAWREVCAGIVQAVSCIAAIA
jgi:hypothetical protein